MKSASVAQKWVFLKTLQRANCKVDPDMSGVLGYVGIGEAVDRLLLETWGIDNFHDISLLF